MARVRRTTDPSVMSIRRSVIRYLDMKLVEPTNWKQFHQNLDTFMTITLNPPKTEKDVTVLPVQVKKEPLDESPHVDAADAMGQTPPRLPDGDQGVVTQTPIPDGLEVNPDSFISSLLQGPSALIGEFTLAPSVGNELLEGLSLSQLQPTRKKPKRKSIRVRICEDKKGKVYHPKRTTTSLKKYLQNWRDKIKTTMEEKVCVRVQLKKMEKIVQDGWNLYNRLKNLPIQDNYRLENDMRNIKTQFEKESPEIQQFVNMCGEQAKLQAAQQPQPENDSEAHIRRKSCCLVCAEAKTDTEKVLSISTDIN